MINRIQDSTYGTYLKRHTIDDVMLRVRPFNFNPSPCRAVLYYMSTGPDSVSLHNTTNQALPEVSSAEAVHHLCKLQVSCQEVASVIPALFILMADVVGC